MYHELIDKDIPKCLFCNSDVDVKLTSEWIGQSSSLRQDVETLTCKKCKEVFEIHSTQGLNGTTVIGGFAFSCKRLRIFHNYAKPHFEISKGLELVIRIPEFPIDFSDKKKLHEKLRTYIVFS